MSTETVEMPLTWQEKLSQLEIKESIPVENKASLRVLINRYFGGTRKKFKVRTIKETGEVRVWRIK